MASNPPPKPKAGLSLYANLLDSPGQSSSSGATITAAPVTFKQPESAPDDSAAAAQKQQQISASALRFQPTKRPAPSAASAAKSVKAAQAKAAALTAAVAAQQQQTSQKNAAARAPPAAGQPKTSLADWTGDGGDDDVNGFFGGEKRQRAGRKKRKKNRPQEGPVAQNWDDVYDPSRPNSYEAYRHSDEKIREVRDWKDKLYAHRMARRRSDDSDSDEDKGMPQRNNRFAPPPMGFVPPPPEPEDRPTPPPIPIAEIPDDPTGEDAYARRLRMSQQAGHYPAPPPPMPEPQAPPPPPSPVPSAQHTIARPAVRYSFPAAPAELPKSATELESALLAEQNASAPDEASSAGADPEADAPRSNRPGQKGFAERLMSKYGWSKGSGLGAQESGILDPLRVKVDKQKKRPNSEGGGFVGPGGMGKIIGGQRKKVEGREEGGKFGVMSEVVVLRGMVDGMDLDWEVGEGNLVQEIGEECGEKYGRVERVRIARDAPDSVPVFIKFTNQLSALRAVNALEGRVFNGNKITARFFDGQRFDTGI